MARRLALGQEGLELRRRIKTFNHEDMDIWTPPEDEKWRPEQHGEREPTIKRAKKAVRQSKAQAQRAIDSFADSPSGQNSPSDDEQQA